MQYEIVIKNKYNTLLSASMVLSAWLATLPKDWFIERQPGTTALPQDWNGTVLVY